MEEGGDEAEENGEEEEEEEGEEEGVYSIWVTNRSQAKTKQMTPWSYEFLSLNQRLQRLRTVYYSRIHHAS